ncbi:MAG TPA: hypothetical protein VMT86_02005, partial [Bryobacteraceae bacterium]|nr:hypothetical protein [Bryobacteraceae bacterium]
KMIDVLETTAFRLVRGLAAIGLESPSIYLLIVEPDAADIFRTDLTAETRIQLGAELQTLTVEEVLLERLAEVFAKLDRNVVLITFDRWRQDVVLTFDRNITLVRNGALLLLASQEIALRILTAAPNLRNRITDILEVRRDLAFGGGGA